MRDSDLRIDDVLCTEEFLVKIYPSLPPRAQKAVNSLIIKVLAHGGFPASLNAHTVNGDRAGLWIGWLSKGSAAWRVWFSLEDHMMVIENVVSHSKQDNAMKGRRYANV